MVITTRARGGEEVFFYDQDAQRYQGMSRVDVAALLLRRWPEDAKRAVDDMHAEPNQRWVVATAGDIFIWMKVSGRFATGAPS